jgi:hypothetical protein
MSKLLIIRVAWRGEQIVARGWLWSVRTRRPRLGLRHIQDREGLENAVIEMARTEMARTLVAGFYGFPFSQYWRDQEEYDAANGVGAFAGLLIPTQAVRLQNPDLYMPASANHPDASERFRHSPVVGNPQYADLGLWNVYLNPNIPNPQTNLSSVVCASSANCAVDQRLATTIGELRPQRCETWKIQRRIFTMDRSQSLMTW